MKSMRLSPLLFCVLLACGHFKPQPQKDGGPTVSSCARYEEFIDGSCSEVTVLGQEEKALSFERAGYEIRGKLTIPRTQGEYMAPGVILVHGSGPNDRDQHTEGDLGYSYGRSIATFKLLAESLTKEGMAVFRYEKRTCFSENSGGLCSHSYAEYQQAHPNGVLVDDFILDARAALHALANQPEVDAHDLTIIGHSQGANFVPKIMLDEPDIVAGVQLAGLAVPIDEGIVAQLRDLANMLEHADAQRYANTISRLHEDADAKELAFSQIRQGTYVGDTFDNASVEFWLNWMSLTDNLQSDFCAVTKPIFVLNGDTDINVHPRNLELFRTWAQQADMNNACFQLLPNVTHSFVELTPNHTGIVSDFSPEAITAIAQWLKDLGS